VSSADLLPGNSAAGDTGELAPMATLHTMDWAGLYVGANAGSYESVQMAVVADDGRS